MSLRNKVLNSIPSVLVVVATFIAIFTMMFLLRLYTG